MQGDMLMVRRLLGNQMQPLDDNQRENIFHTKCTINGKLCSLIIDRGSCNNVASSRLVSKLNLEEKEKSEAPKRNKKRKSEAPKRNKKKKSDTHERKFNCLAKASEVRKVLLACEPLYLLYCKDNTIYANNSNELTIFVSPSVELLLQEFKDVSTKEIPHGLPPSRGIEHQIDL